jgi:hypothetical protein
MPKIQPKSNVMTLKEFQNNGSSQSSGNKYYVDQAEPPIYLRKDEVQLKKTLNKSGLYLSGATGYDYP